MLIKSLSLKDFKCFEQVDIDFGKITLLTGANSSGKSSLIYALLGIMQSKYFPQYFALNGELINMGGFDEVLRKKAEKREFEIGIAFQDFLDNSQILTLWNQENYFEPPTLGGIKISSDETRKCFNIWREVSGYSVHIIEMFIPYNVNNLEKNIVELKNANKSITIENFGNSGKVLEVKGVID
jgi:predicted ATP-dependent endonuclease of OLD family